jgi:DNA-binding protein HU-beta
MTFKELIQAVSDRSGVSFADTQRVMRTLVEETRERLADGTPVRIWGLGTFGLRDRQARVVRAVGTRRKMFVGGRRVVHFKPARAMSEAVDAAEYRDPRHQASWQLAETLLDDLDLYHSGLAPEGLADEPSLEAVEGRCADAFGAHWTRVAETWREKTDPAVETRYLGVVAKRRWA